MSRIRLRGAETLAGGDRVPVVLAHGIFGFGNVRLGPVRHRYFFGVEDTLHAAGHPVLVTRVPPSAPIAERAATLVPQIEAFRRDVGRPVLLVGHSMGGLDLRYGLAHLGLAEQAVALLTVATPHRGSPFADWVVRRGGGPGRLAAAALKRLSLSIDGIGDLTRDFMSDFNDRVPNVPGFRYHGVAAVRGRAETFPGLRFSHDVIAADEGPNDGMVGRTSALWGEQLPDWPCDHTHARNQRFFGADDVGPRYLDAVRRIAG